MKLNMNHPAVAAVLGLVGGVSLGAVVAFATGWNLHVYMRFIGLLVIVALCVVGAWVHQTYIRPKGAHVEETKADAPTAKEVPDGR